MVLIASLTDSEGWEEEQQRRSREHYSSSLISEIFCRLSIPTGYLMLPFLILRQLTCTTRSYVIIRKENEWRMKCLAHSCKIIRSSWS